MKLYILLIFCFFACISYSQNTEYQLIQSELFEDEKFKTTLLFAEEDTNGDIYVVRHFETNHASPKGYYIEYYNAALELLESVVIPIERSEIRGMFIKDGKVVLIEFQYVKEDKAYAFYLLESPKGKLDFSKNKILSIDRSKMHKYDHYGIRKEREYNLGRYYEFGEVVTSKNKEYFSISVLLKQKKGNAFKVHTFKNTGELAYEYLLDEIHETSSSKNYKKTPLLVYQNAIVGDGGITYLLAKIYYDNTFNAAKKGKPNYNYELFKISGQEAHHQVSLLVGENFTHGMRLVSSQDKLFVVGMYKDELSSYFKLRGNDGVARFEVNKETFSEAKAFYDDFSELIKDDLKPKDREVGGQILSAVSGRDSSDKIGVIGFSARKIELLNNDDIILELEQTFADGYSYALSLGFGYGNIVLLRVNREGKLVFDRGIKKSSTAKNYNSVPNQSFASIVNEKGSYVFFNAAAIPERLEDGRMIFDNNNDDYVHLVRITGRGQKNHQRVFHWLDENVSFEFRFAKQIGQNKLLVEAEKDNKPQLMLIEITN